MDAESTHYLIEGIGALALFIIGLAIRGYDRRIDSLEDNSSDIWAAMEKLKDDDRARWDSFWSRLDQKFLELKKEISDMVKK